MHGKCLAFNSEKQVLYIPTYFYFVIVKLKSKLTNYTNTRTFPRSDLHRSSGNRHLL